jgi:uncharacterized protein YicC (UPF0701 family)
MIKTISKKTLAVIIMVSFLSGSIPVYASTLVNQDTIDYITSSLYKYIPGFYENLNSSATDAINQNKEVLKQHIDSSIDQVIMDTGTVTVQEGNRINSELEAYTEELMKEIDPVFRDQEEQIKQIIKEMADKQIQDAKDRLKTELNNELQDMFAEDIE